MGAGMQYRKTLKNRINSALKANPVRACLSLFSNKGGGRFRAATLAGLMVLTLVTTSGVGALIAPNASAATIPTTKESCEKAGGSWTAQPRRASEFFCQISLWQVMTPSEQATSWSYYQTLRGCVLNNMYGDINLAASDDGVASVSKWFNDISAYGYVYPGGTKTDCKDIATKALKLWNVDNPSAFLTTMDYVFESNVPRYHHFSGSNGVPRQASFDKAYSELVDPGVSSRSSLPDYVQYNINMDALTTSCMAQNLGLYSELSNSTFRGWVDNNTTREITGSEMDEFITEYGTGLAKEVGIKVTYKKIKLIDSDGSLKEFAYAYVSSTKVAGSRAGYYDLRANLYGYRDKVTTETCDQIASSLGGLATAYVSWARTHADLAAKDELPTAVCSAGQTVDANGDPCQQPGGDETTSCAIDGIGWVICPVITFVSTITDTAFTFLSDSFLQIQPNVVSGAQDSWSTIRNLANVLFVVVFLIIIFSQLTGQGVTNYGVKKMLPRLIVAAILVNLSFLICQIAVDLSNILGKGLYDLFGVLQSSDLSQAYNPANTGVNGVGGWTTIIVGGAGVLAGGVALLLSISIPVLLASLVAILMIVLILILRIALIVILTVVAPLAFVAFLLPNTENLFKKWMKTFTSLLLVYPIIGVVFGGGVLAAQIINNAASTITDSTIQTLMQITALGVAVIPFFVVPSLLKGSLNSLGTIGTKLSNLSGKANSRVGSRVKTTTRLGEAASSIPQRFAGARARRRVNSRLQKSFDSSRLGRAIGSDRGAAVAAATTAKIRAEEIDNAEKQIAALGLSQDQRQSLALGRDVRDASGKIIMRGRGAAREAAVKIQGQTGKHDQIRELIDARMGGDLSKTLASSLAQHPNKPAWAGAGALERISFGKPIAGIAGARPGRTDSEVLMVEAIENNAYSSEKIASGDNDELIALDTVARNPALVGAADRTRLGDNTREIAGNPELRSKVSKNIPGVTNLSTL